jgi:TRAP-type C4-dicarboxylate transport system substrate-binding protein
MHTPTRRPASWSAVTALVAAALLLAAGCGTSGAGAKAGGSAAPVVLRIGTDDFQDRPASDQIEEFARQVEQLSGGDIEIEPVWHAAGDGPDWDQRVARMVVSGELDMGMIPTRAWDTEGVDTLRALNAPFLITSDAMVEQIVTGELTTDLMAGLDAAGVVGLALLPEGLRHPFALDRPLVAPDDFAGATIRTPTSATTAAVFEALGATPTDDADNTAEPDGRESAYVQHPPGTLVTGNVTFYPKVNSLVVNADAFDDLSDEQREILRDAATRARDQVIEQMPSDAELAAAWCDDGKGVVLASEAELQALEEATEKVVIDLESDAATASLIERIRALPVADAPLVEACDPATLTGPDGAGSAAELNGIYRFEVTDDEIAAVGLPSEAERDNVGVFTITIEGNRWCYELQADQPVSSPQYCDQVAIVDDVLVLSGDDVSAPTEARFRWTLSENGDLEMVVAGAIPEAARPFVETWVFEPWTRIGGVADVADRGSDE